MTDRLKLSDTHGDAEIDKIASALEEEEKQIHRKQRDGSASNVPHKPAPPNGGAVRDKPTPANKIGARKHASFKAISTAPSINLTPSGSGMVPVAYPVVQDLSSSVNVASTVNFNGCPAYLLDASTQPTCTGDAAGTGGGIRSGTVSGEVKPVKGSSTVRIEGKQVIREGDPCTMNGGNNPGVYITVPATSGALPLSAIATSKSPHANKPGFTDSMNPNNRPWNIKNPIDLNKGTPAEQVAAAILMDRHDMRADVSLSAQTSAQKPKGPLLVPWDPTEDAKRLLQTKNSLEMFLLGSFGVFAAVSRLRGESEERVAASNEVGAAAMGVAWSITGIPGRQPISVGLRTLTKPTGKPSNNGVKVIGSRDLTKGFDASKLGRVSQPYDAVNPGPLSDEMASTFSGGKYRVAILEADTIFYRAGVKGQPLGQYFSIEPPVGILQVRIDKAVLPRWPGGGESPMDTAFSVKFPKGTIVYVGNVGSQGGHYVGGTVQVVVVKPWKIDGVKVIESKELK